MAIMIPSVVDKEDFNGSFGEERVYEVLSNLPDEYVVFHSVKWHQNVRGKYVKWGEADFVVLHPEKGMLAVEVKSGGIVHDNYNGWSQINTLDGTINYMKDPMEQAAKSKYAFLDLLPATMQCYIECIVWFPSIDSRKKLKDLPPAYSIENTLIQENLEYPEISLEKAFSYYKMQERTCLSQKDVNEIIRLLSPEFDAIPGIPSSIDDDNYMFNRMTLEQSYLLDYLEEQRSAVIQGGAGTGKTMLALEKAKRLATNGKVLFLCYNNLLLEQLRQNHKEENNIDFYNLPGLVTKLSNGICGSTSESISHYLSNTDMDLWEYKHIIIDEGQDFSEQHLSLLCDFAELTEGSFYVFFDKNQLVQQRGNMGWFNKVECRLVLTTNCRNTQNIALTSNASIRIDKVKMRKDIPGRKTYFYSDKDYMDREHLIIGVEKIIDSYINEGVKNSQIVILTVKGENSSLLHGCAKVGKYKLRQSLNGSGILFTTSRMYKGLESDIVIVIDVDKNNFIYEEDARVLYVATSRARSYLDIFGTMDDKDLIDVLESYGEKKTKMPKMYISKMLKVAFKKL